MVSHFSENLRPRVVRETSEHQVARDRLIKACFGSPSGVRAAHLLRQHTQADARYSSVALDQQQSLLGSIRFFPVLLPDQQPLLMLGPLAINSELRGLGIGSRLVENGLKQLQQDHWSAVLVIGDPGYFVPLGFRPDLCAGLDVAGEVAPLMLMGREWQEGFLASQQGLLSPHRPC